MIDIKVGDLVYYDFIIVDLKSIMGIVLDIKTFNSISIQILDEDGELSWVIPERLRKLN